jgi:hypothetical protein
LLAVAGVVLPQPEGPSREKKFATPDLHADGVDRANAAIIDLAEASHRARRCQAQAERRCQIRLRCDGVKVGWDHWHADHKTAHSKGGKSIVSNGPSLVSSSACGSFLGSVARPTSGT